MLKMFKKLEKQQWLFIFFSFILIVLQVWLDLKLPDYMNDIIQVLQTKGTSPKDLISPGSWMLVCALSSFALAILTGFLMAKVATRFSFNLRDSLFDKITSFNLEEIKKHKIPSLIVRSTNDVMSLQRFLAMGLQISIKAPILAIWAISKIYSKNFTWAMITGGFVLALLIIATLIITTVLPKMIKFQKILDNLNRVARENITGIRVIKAFNAKEYQLDKFEETNELLKKTNLFISVFMAIVSPLILFIMSTLTLSIYYTGAKMIDKATMIEKANLFGNMIIFSSYAAQVIGAFMMLVMIFVIYPRARVSAKRINEVLDEKLSLKEGSFNKETELQGTIEFKNVSFKYPDAEECLLKNISFKVNQGETVAFSGGTASGKSTLINLIPRLYDVTEGEVLVNGVNVKEYKESKLNSIISYIPQQAVIFSGTVKSNVLFGSKRKTHQQIYKALEISQAKKFINSLPKKLNHEVASRGTNLSGGQKQRLSIARGIVREPEIYIFDDTFSALDNKTDLALRRALNKHTKNATSLIVAQRIGTIMHADKIIVLEQGEIESVGTHQELLKKSKIYQEIAAAEIKEGNQ